MGATENGGASLATPTATGLTFSLINSINTGSSGNCAVYLWTATAGSNGSSTLTSTVNATSNQRGLAAYAFSGSDGLGTVATMVGSASKTTSLTRAYDNSAVINLMADWNAVSDTSVTATPVDGTVRQTGYFSGAATFFLSEWGDQGAAGTASYGIANHTGTVRMSGIVVEIKGVMGSVEQEGYRWRDDDGSESGASWLASQDGNITRPSETTTRLRTLLNATDDPDSAQYQLEYKKSTASTYTKVPLSLPAAGAVTYGGVFGTYGASAGATNLTPALPTGVNAQSELWASIGSKNNATHSSSTTGWTKVAQQNSGANWTVSLWRYTGADATAATAPNVTWTGSVNSFAQSWRMQGRTGSDAIGVTSVNTGTTATHTTTGVTTTLSGSRVMYVDAAAANTAVGTPASWTEDFDNGSATGTTHLAVGGRDLGSSGSSSGNISVTGAAAAWVQWQIELPAQQPAFMMTASSNITASGGNTTAQLNAPTGKTTSAFTTGRIQDDENPADAVDITNNNYTELEWSLRAIGTVVTNGEVYRFRVTNNGIPLAVYSLTPEWTIGVANVAPATPTSLAQAKTDNTSLATGAWTNETSIKLSATVTDFDAGDTVKICAEVDPIGTALSSPVGDGDGCSTTGVSSGGTATVTIAGLSIDTEYHWQIKAKDVAGIYSSWTSYGGNVENPSTNPADRDFGIDTSAPTGGIVYDGSNVGSDKNFSDGSLSALTANWAGFNFNVAGIQKYEYSIGVAPADTTIRNWTNVNTNTSVTATGLVLKTSQTYYVNVRAYDNAGNVVTRSSDGQMVAPDLSFTVSPTSTTFNNINASNLYTSTGSTTLKTSTNAYGGYVVRAFATDFLRSPSNFTIGNFSGGSYASPDTWQSGDTGFGYTSSDSDIQGVNKFQGSPCLGGSGLIPPGCYAPFSQTKPGDIIADHTDNITGSSIVDEEFTISLRATTASTQQAAQYQTVLVYSITPLY